MRKKKKKESSTGSVYNRPDYAEWRAINDEAHDKHSVVGKIISTESIRKSSENIHRAIVEAIVNNGHGVLLKRTS